MTCPELYFKNVTEAAVQRVNWQLRGWKENPVKTNKAEKEEPEKNGRKALCTKYESRIRKTQKCLKDE